jgi:hypothetical protein
VEEGSVMQAWLDIDDDGRQFLVRTGTGVVTAVVAEGLIGPDDTHYLYRVEIYCDAPHGRPGAIRYSAHPVVTGGGPLHRMALEALEEVWAVEWTIQWHRHEWIPAHLPIGSLDLASDARSILVALDPVAVPELVDADVPDFVPATWADEGP